MRRASVTFLRKLTAAGVAESKPRTEHFIRLRPFSSGYEKPKKESPILEMFRQRKLQGSQMKKPSQKSSSDSRSESRKSGAAEAAEVVSSFAELGLKEELISAAEEMGVRVPDEIQCVGIPAILEGKSVVLSCEDGDGGGRTLAYLLPLIQMLRQDETATDSKKHPKAVVLCPTEDVADEVFRGAKFVCDLVTRSRPEVAEVSIGLLVGTPEEILQQMEDGTIVVDDIKHLVLDEADTMLELGHGSQISKIIRPLRTSKSAIQTILASSPITKMLSEDYSPLMNQIERENAGQVAAMLLEMDQEEAFDIMESPGALKRKIAEAMDSLSSEEASKKVSIYRPTSLRIVDS